MSFALGVLAVIGLFVSVLLIVSALFFLIRVPNLLQDISYYLRKLAEASADDKHNDHKINNATTFDLENTVREDFENSTTLR